MASLHLDYAATVAAAAAAVAAALAHIFISHYHTEAAVLPYIQIRFVRGGGGGTSILLNHQNNCT